MRVSTKRREKSRKWMITGQIELKVFCDRGFEVSRIRTWRATAVGGLGPALEFYISVERQNLTPRSGATRTLDRSHTACAVGYDLTAFGLAGLARLDRPGGLSYRAAPVRTGKSISDTIPIV